MEYKNIEDLNAEAVKYQNVSTEDLVNLFKNNHIYLPDYVHRFILVNVLKPYVFDMEKMQVYTDELLYRLRSYNYFSVYLLETLVTDLGLKVNVQEYKNLFMRFFLKNEKKFKTTIAFEKSLQQLANKKTGKGEDFLQVMDKFHALFYTPKGYLDGLSLSILKESVNETYTLPELKELGAKYNVEVPRRINKNQLLEILAARFQLSAEEKESLNAKSVLDLTKYAKEKGFKISTDLKKSDMVEYIIYSLSKYHEEQEKDLFNYDVLTPEEDIDEALEQNVLEATDQSIPVSAEYVAEPEPEPTPEPEPEPTPEPEPVKEPEPEPEPEPAPAPAPAPVQKEAVPEPVEDNAEVYYDESVDEEIRKIIKSYYAKKVKKDRGARWIIVVLFVLVLAALAYFALKYFNVF